jgi:type II secretory pathway pseudopilin PulG
MRNVHHKRAFTLVEAVVSTLLLVMVIAGAYTLINQSSRLIRGARNHYVAINIAKARIERARNFPYNQLPLMQEAALTLNDDGTPDSSGYFRRSTLVSTNEAPGLTRITVQVEMRNLKTRQFIGEKESITGLFTEYINL